MKLFQKIQLKFVVIPLAIGGTLLAIVFSTIFCITYFGINKTALQSITATLDSDLSQLENRPLERNSCITIVEVNESFKTYNSQFYSKEIINKLTRQVSQNKQYNFGIDERRFKMAYQNIIFEDTKAVIYAIYDITDEYQSLKTLANSLLIIYILSLIILSIISYGFSNSAVKPIKDAFYKQQELIANASHELKTPLTIISTNLDLVCSDSNQTIESNKKWLESAKWQLSRMNNLILQMLELSSLDCPNCPKKLDSQNVNLSELSEGLLLSFEATCFEKSITYECNIQPNIYYLCDKTEIEKLITILVDNAIKYTPSGQNFVYELQRMQKKLSIKVTNFGIGLTPEQTNQIFERFYKTDDAHKETGISFGLGLSIAKLLAQSMNGNITCNSQIDKFVSFEITLPLQ